MIRTPPARWLACGLAAAVIVAVLTSAWLLRGKPPTVSVGDEALLEIYTLHAAHGTLRVGAYSRFQWNHPGPALFYAFAPGYVLSGHREDSLFATTLVLNVATFALLLWTLRRYWGNAMACAAAGWVLVFAWHPVTAAGFDFGDWLASAWNPHASMLPLALLIVASAVVAAGVPAWLPGLTAIAAFVIQAHVGLAPVSLTVGAAAVSLCALAYVHRPEPRLVAAPPVWARVLDGLAGLYAALLVWVVVAGGFDAHVAGHTVTVNSAPRLLGFVLVLLALRHAGSRRHPVFREVARRVLGWRWLSERGPWPAHTRAHVAGAAIVAAIFWCLPVLQQVTAPSAGNLTELLRFAGGGERNASAGFAAFTYYLSGVLWRGLEVAAGGRTISTALLSWPAVALSLGQIAALAGLLWQAIRTRAVFRISLCLMCLVASAAALLSMLHVSGGLYDHLAFWIVMVGLVNLATITGAAAGWLWTQSAAVRRIAPVRLGPPLLLLAVVLVAGRGGQHLLAGHQQTRFGEEVAAARTFTAALDEALQARGLSGAPVALDASSDAWGIMAGVVLERYKRGPDVTVAPGWVPIFGVQLAPSGREAVEAAIVDPEHGRALADEPAFEFVARAGRLEMYLRRLSRADRVRRQQPAS